MLGLEEAGVGGRYVPLFYMMQPNTKPAASAKSVYIDAQGVRTAGQASFLDWHRPMGTDIRHYIDMLCRWATIAWWATA